MDPRVSLSKHLATIESYLEDYRAIHSDSDSTVRYSNRDKFHKYILTSCWKKMHTRAEHWISIGMITSICNIPEASVTVMAKGMEEWVQVDRDLMEYLKGSEVPVGEIMAYHIDRIRGQPDPKYNALDPIVNVEPRNVGNQREVYLYTPEIALAFHRLLVSCLLSYVFCLRIVDKAVKAFPLAGSTGPPPPIQEAFFQLLLSAELLFVLSHSRLFKWHSSIFNHLVIIPTEASLEIYTQDFKRFTEWHAANHVLDKKLTVRIETLATSQDSPRSPSKSVQASAVKGPATEASASEESDAEINEEVLNDSDGTVGVVYRKWIMGLVDHFASIRVLERVCGKLPPKGKINFSILGLNRQELQFGSWDTIVTQIQKLCEDSSLVSKASNKPLPPDLANKVIEIIKTKINEYEAPTLPSAKKTSGQFGNKVYAFFQTLLSNGEPSFSACGHCEAILMAIIHRVSTKDDLDFSLKACLR